MNIQDYLGSIGVFLALMAAAAILEAAVPLFAARAAATGRRAANLAMTMQVFVTNFLVSTLVALAAPRLFEGAGLSGPLLAAQSVAGFVAMDFAFGYFAHRTMHTVPLLWRFHRVHHSDAFVDVTTTYRTHGVEVAWRYACLAVPIAALGLSPGLVAAYRLLSAINGVLEHANIRVAARLDEAIARVWVTPNMHKVHHSRVVAETDSNYGNLLSVYDRLLGTFTPTARAFEVKYGLDDCVPERETFLGLLAMPWRKTSGAATDLPRLIGERTPIA